MLGAMTANKVLGIGGGVWTLIPISFSTDASDDPTLDKDYDGSISIARVNTTDYRITLPGPFDFAMLVPAIGVAGTDFVDGFATSTTNGTVDIETNNGLTSAECQCIIAVYTLEGD